MNQPTTLTANQRMMIGSARLSPPAAWIVSTTGGRTGLERVAWKKNCQRLIDMGYLYANGHGDYTLTDEGEKIREEIAVERGLT
jgi:hypothetical protein